MNTRFGYILTALALTALLAGCAKDSGKGERLLHDATPIAFTSASGVFAQPTAGKLRKSLADSWTTDMNIGIRTNNGATNYRYKVESVSGGTATFAAVSDVACYPQDGSNIRIWAYYPYSASADNENDISIANQGSDAGFAAADVMYAEVTSANKESGTVELSFEHSMSKLRMTVVKGTAITSLDGLTVTVKGMKSTGTMALSTGIITLGDNGDIATHTADAEGNTIREAILFPQGTVADAEVEFKLGDDKFYWDISAISFAAGNAYDYTITINRTGITATPSSGATLWESGATIGVTGTPFTPIDLAGLTEGSSGSGWSYTGNVLTLSDGANVLLTGATSNCVEVAAGATATVVLKDVSITSGSEHAFKLQSGADVALYLEGDNQIKATAESKAAICAPSGTTLSINSASEANTLTATGGQYAAGIGGGDGLWTTPPEGDCGTITISGGTITATGGNNGAGIGGGRNGNGGTITISGGIINATGKISAAGIGGGHKGNSGTITISGGTVTATKGPAANYDIGAGYNGEPGTILITGGNITAGTIIDPR